MKKTSGLSLVLLGICTFGWTIGTILNIDVNPLYRTLLNLLCALLWGLSFIVNFKRYNLQKKETM